MAQYDVDILLKITGQQELKSLQAKLGAAEKAAEGLNKNLRALNKFDVSGATRRVNIEQKLLNITRERLKLQRQFNESTSEGNRKARQAAADFIRRQRIYRQGMAQYAGPIGPGAASPLPESSPVALSTQLRGRLNRQLKEAADLQTHLGRMEQRSLETNKRLLNNQKLQKKELGKIVGEKVKGIQADKKAADQAARNARKRSLFGDATASQRAGAAVSAGAFPLLFGGGPGMALGGAIGGAAAGATFGPAAIALQVLGGALDQFVAKTAATGQALNELTFDFDTVMQAAGLAGTATASYIAEIEKLADSTEAQEIATKALAIRVGGEAVQSLKTFGEAGADLGREFSTATTIFGSAIASLIAPLTSFTAKVFEANNALVAGRANVTADPELERLAARESALRGRISGVRTKGGSVQATQDSEELARVQQQIRDRQLEIEQSAERTLEVRAKTLQRLDNEKSLQTDSLQVLALKNQLVKGQGTLTEENIKQLKEQILQAEFLEERQHLINRAIKDEISFRAAAVAIETKRVKLEEALAALNKPKDPAKPRKLTAEETGEGIARRLREQIAAYEELDPFARKMAVIEAERESIQERINKVLDEQKKKELTMQNNNLKDLKVSQEKQKIEDEIINLQLKKEDQINAENAKLSNTIDNYHEQLRLLQAKIDGTEDQVALEIQLEKAGTDIERNYINQVNRLKEQVQVVENLDRIYDQIGQSIASGVVDTLSAAVDQTKSLADAAANTLRNIANILLQLGTNTLLKGTGLSVFENLQGFANGGRPPVNRPSIVGERGPELFVPGAQGNIVPNHAMGSSNIVVNVDASGTQAQGDQPNAKALGSAIGAAVQAELIKQKRPGGLLA